jgi:hypothetical protein
MALTAAAATSNSTIDAAVSTEVNFPVIPAKIDYAPKADLTSVVTQGFANDEQVILSLVVNRDGKAHNVKVVSSDNPALNGPLMVAVSKYHFHAATEGSQTIPYHMNLAVMVQRTAAKTLVVK